MKVPSLALPTIAPSRFNYWHRFRTKISVPRKNVHATIITFYDPYIFCNKKKSRRRRFFKSVQKVFAASGLNWSENFSWNWIKTFQLTKVFFSLSSSRPFEKKIKFEKRWTELTELRWNELNLFEPEPCSSFQCRAQMSRRLSKYPLIPLRAQAFLLINTNKSKLEPTMSFFEI